MIYHERLTAAACALARQTIWSHQSKNKKEGPERSQDTDATTAQPQLTFEHSARVGCTQRCRVLILPVVPGFLV
eukprot:61617-Pleurochrysis_carterae.AAC.7